MIRRTTIITSSYYDSVVLMRVASQLKKRDGVSEVALFMGTQNNHELLSQVGLATEESTKANPRDLIVIVEAESEERAASIAEEAVASLSSRSSVAEDASDYRPRTLDAALNLLPDATLAAISVPGEYAAREAERCLEKGLNVFLFSDNVPVVDEIRLKAMACERNLLFMGPDCGTAYLGGVGLGFANVAGSGRVGCIGASGTGLQAVVCRLDRLGEGISHGIGVGGRDLGKDVGGRMTMQALDLLAADRDTAVIVIISKPPDPEVAELLRARCAQLGKPVVTCFQGARPDGGTVHQAATLDEAAERAVCLLRGTTFTPRYFNRPDRIKTLLDRAGAAAAGSTLVGLFTGGTLAKEAMLILNNHLADIAPDCETSGHMIVDLGDDRYTVGRPHPMIAPENRTDVLNKLAETGSLEQCGVLLFDLVLGTGSHMDPAGELVAGVERIRRAHGIAAPAVAAVIGTAGDPQDLQGQIDHLHQAGVTVFRSNSEAARFAAMLIDPAARATYLEDQG